MRPHFSVTQCTDNTIYAFEFRIQDLHSPVKTTSGLYENKLFQLLDRNVFLLLC